MSDLKFKVGDTVKLVDKRPGGWNTAGEMDKFLSSIQTIKKIYDCDAVEFENPETHRWSFDIDDIEYKVSTGIDYNICTGKINICADKINITNNESEENKMNCEKILEIYKENEYEKLDKKYQERIKTILENDEINYVVQEFSNQINTMLENDGQDAKIFINQDNPPYIKRKTQERIDKTKRENVLLHQELKEKINEIRAMLEIAPDYETTMKILERYGVINKKTKMIKKGDK